MGAGTPEKIRDELRQARRRDHVHGAYLIEGGPGTGKLATAVWFAGLLLCRAGADDPCGTCHDCRLMASQAGEEETPPHPRHPDLKWVEPDGTFVKVDQIRDLQRELSLVANEGGRRVAIVAGADRLRVEASNALLKTLEEPPRATVLILVADSSEGLPRTVRSRAVRLRLAPTPEAEIRAQLAQEGMDATDAWLASAVAGGSPAAAQAWSEENLEDAREIYGMLDGIAKCGASEILDFAEGFRGGERARKRAELLLAVHGAHARREADQAAQRRDSTELSRWTERFEAGERAHRELRRRNLNPQLVVEGLLIDLRSS